jgi:hypothetical protein
MNSLKNRRKQLGNMKITSDLTNLTTAILILTVQMFFEWTLRSFTKFQNHRPTMVIHFLMFISQIKIIRTKDFDFKQLF